MKHTSFVSVLAIILLFAGSAFAADTNIPSNRDLTFALNKLGFIGDGKINVLDFNSLPFEKNDFIAIYGVKVENRQVVSVSNSLLSEPNYVISLKPGASERIANSPDALKQAKIELNARNIEVSPMGFTESLTWLFFNFWIAFFGG